MMKIIMTALVIAAAIIGGYMWNKQNLKQKKVLMIEESAKNGPPKNFKYPTENPPYGNPDISTLIPQEQGLSVKEIPISAFNWYFEPSEIRVKQGERVRITMKSISGVHALAIPDLDIKSEAAKEGESVSIEFTAEKKGEFPFRCSFYCGEGHSGMNGKLIVEE